MIPFASDPDRESERRALIEAAQAGNARAQKKLGDLCRIGDNLTKQDCVEAIRWYRLAAEQGNAEAQNDLGVMHLNGMGVREDAAEAARWYRRAAEQGVAIAQFNLACRYVRGDGVEHDDREAVGWLLQAAHQGHVEATAQLGELFRFGRGVERNVVTAARLHVKAAAAGEVVSVASLADYHHDIEEAALGGSLRAALALATMYEAGLGVKQSPTVAYSWLLVGRRFGFRDDEQAARDELYDRDLSLNMELSSDQEAEAYRLVAIMCANRDE